MRSVRFEGEAPDLEGVDVVEIDGSMIEDKDELMDAVSEGFGFPGWFGHNWDALEECLRDLDPAEGGRALVVRDATALWSEHPRLAGGLVEIWLDVAERREDMDTAFLLIFEW